MSDTTTHIADIEEEMSPIQLRARILELERVVATLGTKNASSWDIVSRIAVTLSTGALIFVASELRDLRVDVTKIQTRVERNEQGGTPASTKILTELSIGQGILLRTVSDLGQLVKSMDDRMHALEKVLK